MHLNEALSSISDTSKQAIKLSSWPDGQYIRVANGCLYLRRDDSSESIWHPSIGNIYSPNWIVINTKESAIKLKYIVPDIYTR